MFLQGVSANYLRFFLQTLILRGLQHFFFLIIITFSWFDTILTPIFYFWCQLIATLSSLVISLSILDISLTWLYTSIVTSMWACPIIYWRTFTSILFSAILVQAVCRIMWADTFGNTHDWLVIEAPPCMTIDF